MKTIYAYLLTNRKEVFKDACRNLKDRLIKIYIKRKTLHVVESLLFGDGGMVDAERS